MADKIDISGLIVRKNDGSVNVQATHARFTQELSKYTKTENADNEVIKLALTHVFRDQGTKNLTMTELIHHAMKNLDLGDENFNQVRQRMVNYIRGNSRLFAVKKGPGGGVSLQENEDVANTNNTLPPTSSRHASIRPRALSPNQ